MVAKIIIIAILVLIAALILTGVSLIRGWWQPVKDVDGKVVPLTQSQKIGVGVVVAGFVLGLMTLLFGIDHPWVKKIKGQK